MHRKLLAATGLLALIAPAAAVAAPPSESTSDIGYAIVTFKDAPIATYAGGKPGLAATKPEKGRLDPSSPAYRAYERFLENERASYKAFLAQRLPEAEVVAEYDTVLNGVAVELNGASLKALANNPKVAGVEASWLYRPTMNESVEIINASAIWESEANATDGEGIDVGIIDSGIQDEHPFFECKEIDHKVYASGVAGSGEDIVFNHGTHVAGTVAGCVTELGTAGLDSPIEGTISGVAPGANLHDYNVFPGYGGGYVAFGGSAFSHDIARAVEDAVDDGMDVVNMSLGGTIQGVHDYLAEAVNAAAAAGVVVAVSAGNEGPGPSTIGSPGNATGALTSGATTNSHYIGVNVATSFGDFGGAVGDFDPFAASPVTDAPFASWSDGDNTACTGTPDADVTGAVVLIQRGGCTFDTKVQNAANAGAIGVVVYNSQGGDPIAMGSGGGIDTPAVMVSDTAGATIRAAIEAASESVTIDGSNPVEIVTDNADILAGFSSRGPSNFTENIKPDVVAPGVNIYSSAFDEVTGELAWMMMQGTSMASPHTAGAAALLLAQREDLSPADVKSLLGNSAVRDVWMDQVGGELAGVMERGGGRIDLANASAADITFDPMSLSFGITKGNRPVTTTITVTVKNLSEVSQDLEISTEDDRLSLSDDGLTLAAGEMASFDVTLSARGSAHAEGDVTVSVGDTDYLIPFWYSVGK